MRNIKFMNETVNEMNVADIEKFVSGADTLAEQIPGIEREIAIDTWDFAVNEDMAIGQLPDKHNINGVSACHAMVLASAAAIAGDIELIEFVKVVTDIYATAAADARHMCTRLNDVGFYGLEEKYSRIKIDQRTRTNYRKVLGLLYGIDMAMTMAKA